MRNKLGQNNIEGIVGSILGVFVILIFVSAMVPLITNLNGSDDKQKEIDNLKGQISTLNQEIDSSEVKISELQSNLDTIDKTLNEKILGNFTLKKPILNSMYTAFRNNELEDDVFKDFEYLHEMGVREENELYLSEEDFYLLSGLFEYEEYITLIEETSNLQGDLIKMTLQLNWLIDNNNRPIKIKLVKE